MNLWLVLYLIGVVVFYIGAAAVYLDCERRVTLLKLVSCLFLFAPFVALIWPLALLCVALETSDDIIVWDRNKW
jgi:hypothetical protein